jgi:hypothetical protein
MEVGDYTSTVACFMRLTWAAAAGRLDLVGSPQPIRDSHSSLLPQGVRTRVSSTGKRATSKWNLVVRCGFISHSCLECVFSFFYCQQMSRQNKHPADQASTAYAAKIIVNHTRIQANDFLGHVYNFQEVTAAPAARARALLPHCMLGYA